MKTGNRAGVAKWLTWNLPKQPNIFVMKFNSLFSLKMMKRCAVARFKSLVRSCIDVWTERLGFLPVVCLLIFV